MPSSSKSKGKSKEDTWGATELTNTIQEAMADEAHRKHKDKNRHKDREGEHGRREKKRDDEKGYLDRHEEKRHRDRDEEKRHRERERERQRHKERRKDVEENDNKRRDEERSGKHKDKESESRKHKERERGHHDERDEKERRDRKEREGEKYREKDREKRKDRESEKRHDGERNKDGDRKVRDGEKRKDNDKARESSHKNRDKDRERHRDERTKDRKERRDRSKDGSRDREKRKDESHRDDKRSHREKDSERRRKHEKEDVIESEKHRRRREETDEERDRRREERKRREHEQDRDNKDSDLRKKREGETEEERKRRHDEKRRKRKEEKQKSETEKEAIADRNSSNHSSSSQKKTKVKESTKAESIEDIEESIVPDAVHAENAPDDDEGYDDYEDDFEDYDDDEFEVDDDGDNDENDDSNNNLDDQDLLELKRAMAAENEAVYRKENTSRSDTSSASTRPTTSSRRTFINFVAAKQRQISDKVSKKTRKRGEDLMKLIELDTVAFDLFDMPPVKDYERYIRHFGRSNTRQITTQTNDDNLERETQTEDIESREKWTQHPAEGIKSSGVGDENVSVDDYANQLHEMIHSLRLSQFLEDAGQLMITLLEEERAEIAGGNLKSNHRHIVFSDGYTQLNTDILFLHGRPVLEVQIHPVQTHFVMTVHALLSMVNKTVISRRGLICIWNINAPARPVKVLCCHSQPTSCCWSPTKATLAFSGTEDGSIVLWDLREPCNMHQQHCIGEDTWTVRVPTYSTDGVQTDESHHSRVVAIQPIVSPQDNVKAAISHTKQEAETSSNTFQLASIEEKGVIHFWVVLEVEKTPPCGSESELGLVPSGRVKLIRSSSLSLITPSRDLGVPSTLRVHCFQLNPFDPNHIFVGTDQGVVIHTSRHQGKVNPKSYHGELDVPVDIISIDFSPFGLSCFLVACKDGSIRLHKTSSEFPLAVWSNSTNGMDISGVAWSHSKPSVFFVIDVTSKVYVWSLLEREGTPIKTEQFSDGRLTTLAVSNDFSGNSQGMPGRRPEMILTNDKGGIEVHRLNQQFAVAGGDELDSMAALLDSLV